MQQNVPTIPDYREIYKKQLRSNEYMLVLMPHEELRNKIMQVKKEFFEHYEAPTAISGKAHITLLRFTQLEMLEERIVNRLKTIAMGHYPFKVELKDYGSFPSHTLYIQVATRQPVQQLVRKVRESQRLLKLDKEHKPHFLDEPYITVAHKLVPWQYEKAWQEYSHRQFTGRFVADSMFLLKRRTGERAWQIAQRFEFLNLPVSTTQGELLF
ncbi:MAG: 2'-5' RNA ligase family protein [Candidatus Pseudobacter hemicellulosilyticus]|uniref:2'-5' RNA ligase family protein n=1 Tax=Candidatus Pseudobacter hemicellulosilyticus TaxID=3121375 RepID=A0AAJ5WVV7_9BACT|nr:MAG: 2'-5' RNA ligase family protein [Pseudobacter sp.]